MPITGAGFTVTVVVKIAPAQPAFFGVTWYVNVETPLVVFVKVSLTELWFVCEPKLTTDPNGLIVGAVQSYVVPDGTIFVPPLSGFTINWVPLQIVVVSGPTFGVALTVTLIVKLDPEQPPIVELVGLNVKTTSWSVFAVLNNVGLNNVLGVLLVSSPVTFGLSFEVQV